MPLVPEVPLVPPAPDVVWQFVLHAKQYCDGVDRYKFVLHMLMILTKF